MSYVVRDEQLPRIYFDEPVAIFVPGQQEPLEGRALNLSEGGIFVRGALLPEGTTSVNVRFCLPDDPGHAIEAEARTVRRVDPRRPEEPPGLALCFEAMDEESATSLRRFIDERLRPAAGEAVRLQLGELGFPIRAQAHSSWANILAVDAELPFLRLGSPVHLTCGDGEGQGSIRWVSVHVVPETGVPRINIGIDVEPPTSTREVEGDWADEGDPVCTVEFVAHSLEADRVARSRRRASLAGS